MSYKHLLENDNPFDGMGVPVDRVRHLEMLGIKTIDDLARCQIAKISFACGVSLGKAERIIARACKRIS